VVVLAVGVQGDDLVAEEARRLRAGVRDQRLLLREFELECLVQGPLQAEARRVLRPGGVFAGFDGVGSLLFWLIHLGDTYNPVDPETLGWRLEAAGFAGVAVERGVARFRFRATRR
jgi:hypothetical protein